MRESDFETFLDSVVLAEQEVSNHIHDTQTGTGKFEKFEIVPGYIMLIPCSLEVIRLTGKSFPHARHHEFSQSFEKHIEVKLH